VYIIFEGIDTTGKSTQIQLLRETLRDVVTTREPGGSRFGKDIREILLQGELNSSVAETFLFLADRAEHRKVVIEPNLKRGRLVVSDRGFISGIAYSLANGEENLDRLIELNRYAMAGIFPTLVIFFEIGERELVNRLKREGREIDRVEKRGVEYMLSVQRYMKIVIERVNLKSKKIDASNSIESVHKEILESIHRHHKNAIDIEK
jgi:dTMP kinase